MGKNLVRKLAITIGLTMIMTFSANAATPINTAVATPQIAKTKPWQSIENHFGGMPKSVRKIEYSGSIFYLAENVTDSDFLAVLKAGPEAVNLVNRAVNSNALYRYPVYILWNSDKTVLLVHPIMFDYEMVIDTVATAVPLPIGADTVTAQDTTQALDEATEYMLSKEYADAVRTEFYRLVNEHRAAHGRRKLEVNLELQGYADIRAAEQKERFGHTRPNGSAAGSGWHNSKNNLNTRYAENALATGALGKSPISTAAGIFGSWKESEGHNNHMLYKFGENTTMALGIAPEIDEDGFVVSGAIFATGY